MKWTKTDIWEYEPECTLCEHYETFGDIKENGVTDDGQEYDAIETVACWTDEECWDKYLNEGRRPIPCPCFKEKGIKKNEMDNKTTD